MWLQDKGPDTEVPTHAGIWSAESCSSIKNSLKTYLFWEYLLTWYAHSLSLAFKYALPLFTLKSNLLGTS